MPKIPTRNQTNAQEEIRITDCSCECHHRGLWFCENCDTPEKIKKLNSVQRIPGMKIDATRKQLKYLKKEFIKESFTRWERIKLFFRRIKI